MIEQFLQFLHFSANDMKDVLFLFILRCRTEAGRKQIALGFLRRLKLVLGFLSYQECVEIIYLINGHTSCFDWIKSRTFHTPHDQVTIYAVN